MSKNDLVLQKPSVLISIDLNRRLSTTEYKVYNCLLFNAKNQICQNENGHAYSIKVSDLKEFANINAPNRRIKEYARGLLDARCFYNILDKDNVVINEGGFVLVAGVDINSRAGHIKYSFPHQIDEILRKPNMYALLDMNVIISLSSKYSVRLYELCKDYENSPTIPEMDIETFRRFFNVNGLYEDGANIRRYVIEPSVSEINGNPKISFSVGCNLIKAGNKYVAVKFAIFKKAESKVCEVITESENGKSIFALDIEERKIEQKDPQQLETGVLFPEMLEPAKDNLIKKKKIMVSFNFYNANWEHITEENLNIWRSAYPACDIDLELNAMKAWLLANPDKKKIRYERFIVNWLSRTQQRGGNKLNGNNGGFKTFTQMKEEKTAAALNEVIEEIRGGAFL